MAILIPGGSVVNDCGGSAPKPGSSQRDGERQRRKMRSKFRLKTWLDAAVAYGITGGLRQVGGKALFV